MLAHGLPLSELLLFLFCGGTRVEVVVHAEHMIDNNEKDETHTTVTIENLRLIKSIADGLVEVTTRCSRRTQR